MAPLLRFRAWRPLRQGALAVFGIATVAVGVWCLRGLLVHRATAQQAAPTGATSAPLVTTAAATTSDYGSRVVAYIHNNQPITRQDLGEYLVARYGAEKLPLMLNTRLLEMTCKEHNAVVTPVEIDATLAQDLKGLGIDQQTFIKTVLPGKYKKNLYEWKEDVLRPRLQMMRLVKDRVNASPEELRKAYESVYGEKVECRIILWPAAQEQQALNEYNNLRQSEAAFAAKAKAQEKSELSAAGGKIQAISRHTMDENVEREVFKLRPGEVTTQIRTPQGIVMLKCDKRIPADTTVNFDSVKDKLAIEIKERKLQVEIATVFQALRTQARPQPLLKKSDRAEPGPYPPPNQVVAYLYGSTPVTREELGEFLIARYGADKLEFLVNRRIIDVECKAKNITVSEEEIDKSLADDLKLIHLDKAHFEKDLLAKWNKSMYEWREDVIRPKLLLTKLCQGRVKCTEEDVKKGFEAYYGERLECRVILWPPDQAKFAMAEYPLIRDSEEAFARKAKSQPSASLASQGGKIPVFGRNALGDEKLEREAFKLQPGEISALIGTPQGQVVIKCDKRIPPDKTHTLEKERAKITEEVLRKKVDIEMQVVFAALRDQAKPRLLLRRFEATEDIKSLTDELLSDFRKGKTNPPKK